MEVFSFTNGGLETLEAFNTRLRDFCVANPVLTIVPSTAHDTLLLSLVEAVDAIGDDMAPEDAAELVCFIPVVMWVEAKDLPQLERQLSAVVTTLREADSDDNPSAPAHATLYPTPGGAFVVLLINSGGLDLSGAEK